MGSTIRDYRWLLGIMLGGFASLWSEETFRRRALGVPKRQRGGQGRAAA